MFFHNRHTTLVILLSLSPFYVQPVIAQDSAFIACASLVDRGQRIACLEDALEAATSDEDSTGNDGNTSAESSSTVAVPPSGNNSDDSVSSASSGSAERAAEPERINETASNSERLANFGLEQAPRVASDEEGRDELHDSVVSIDTLRPNILQLTLASGQVWRQLHPKRFNLRSGDEVRIYSTGWGNNYRLETPRLSGFIQVGRLE